VTSSALRARLLVKQPHLLDLLNLVRNLLLVVSRRLYTPLRISDTLEHVPALLKVLRVDVFLLSDLTHQDTELIGNIADGIVIGLLAPFRELASNGTTLAASGLVSSNDVGLSLDQLVELLREILFGGTPETVVRYMLVNGQCAR
jgi:hypothetical protein